MSDLYFHHDRIWGTERGLGNYGIAGAESLWTDDGIDYVCDAGDPICNTPHGSPLRTLAAFLTSMGPDAGMPPRMRARLAAAAVGRRYDLGAYREALDLLDAYTRRGAHVTPYPALLRQVADDINRSIR